MVHVIQTNPESPSLLSTKPVCQLNDFGQNLALHGLNLIDRRGGGGGGQTVPVNHRLFNSCLFNIIPGLCDSTAWSSTFAANNLETIKANLSQMHAPPMLINGTFEALQRENILRTTSSMNNQMILPDDMSAVPSDLMSDDFYHIFVGDLASDIEDDVLLAAFNSFGSVTHSAVKTIFHRMTSHNLSQTTYRECKIIKDMHTQKPKGYGFVAYKLRHEAERAIQAMNGKLLGTRVIRTNWAVRRDPADQAKDHRPLNYVEVFNASSVANTTIYVGGITTGLTESLLHKAFQEFGEIKEVRIFKEKGFSFVRFASHAAATRAIVTMHGRLVGDQSCKCSWGKEPSHPSRLSLSTSNLTSNGLLDIQCLNNTATTTATPVVCMTQVPNTSNYNQNQNTFNPIAPFPLWPACGQSPDDQFIHRLLANLNPINPLLHDVNGVCLQPNSASINSLITSHDSRDTNGYPNGMKQYPSKHPTQIGPASFWPTMHDYRQDGERCLQTALMNHTPVTTCMDCSTRVDYSKSGLSKSLGPTSIFPDRSLIQTMDNIMLHPAINQLQNEVLENLSFALPTMAGLQPGMMTMKAMTDRTPYCPSYQPLITTNLTACPMLASFQPSISNELNARLGLTVTSPPFELSGFANSPTYGGGGVGGAAMPNPPTLIPITLSDLTTGGGMMAGTTTTSQPHRGMHQSANPSAPYGCGFLPLEPITRTQFIPTLNGVPLLC